MPLFAVCLNPLTISLFWECFVILLLYFWLIGILSNHIYTYSTHSVQHYGRGMVSIATMIMFNYCVMYEKQCFGEHHRCTTINNETTLYCVRDIQQSLSFFSCRSEGETRSRLYVVTTDQKILYSSYGMIQFYISLFSCYNVSTVLTAVCVQN